MGFEPARAETERNGPITVRDTGRPGRGSVLGGKYRLEMLLGEGGMACVWSAYNIELELPVAIKVLRGDARGERLAERLRHEARAAAQLVHPGIVRVFDVALAQNGVPFIVMELLTGETLAARLARGPLDPVSAVRLLLPIADALSFAHAHGIVHRDVKPANVLLATDGELLQPKLVDFGISKLSRESGPLDRLTEKGTTLGSPNYMSPEQVRGDEVDCRSDVWSFCVLLYKCIAGFAPFQAADKHATLDAIMHTEPEPIERSALVDAELSRLIHAGLAKDPAERPASMRELERGLAAWLARRGAQSDVPLVVVSTPSVEHPRPSNSNCERDQPTERIVPPHVASSRAEASRRRAWLPWLIGVALCVSGALLCGLEVAGRSSLRSPLRSLVIPRGFSAAEPTSGTELLAPSPSLPGAVEPESEVEETPDREAAVAPPREPAAPRKGGGRQPASRAAKLPF
jgi:serine/threonine protein kinase